MLSAGNEELFDTWGTNSLYKAWCDEGYFDKTAGLYWAAEVEVIRNVIAWKVDVNITDLLIFVSIWYLFTIVTYGTNVPAGLFLPGIIIGCVLGKITFIFADINGYLIYDMDDPSQKESLMYHYIVLGCGAFMAGYTRMTFSLGVILMETSLTTEGFVPMLITIFVSNRVGYLFTRSLYERATRAKQMPILVSTIPTETANVSAKTMMSESIVSLKAVEKISTIMEALESTHHGFPVLNRFDVPIGVISRNYLLTVLGNKGFYKGPATTVDNSTVVASYNTEQHAGMNQTMRDYPPMQKEDLLSWQLFASPFGSVDKSLNEEVKTIAKDYAGHLVDLRPYLIPNPVTVFTTDVLSKCLLQFRFN